MHLKSGGCCFVLVAEYEFSPYLPPPTPSHLKEYGSSIVVAVLFSVDLEKAVKLFCVYTHIWQLEVSLVNHFVYVFIFLS